MSQLINHRVATSIVEKIDKEIEAFFNMPLEEKNKYKRLPEDDEGFGQLFVTSKDPKLDWGDVFCVLTLPSCLRKPHLFPNVPPAFREALETCSAELRKPALKLLDCMAKALKMDPNDMRVLLEEGKREMRMNYFPSCPQPDLVLGITAHSDSAGLNILRQINEVEGLQIKRIITNGIYPSIEHRVAVNVNKREDVTCNIHQSNFGWRNRSSS